MRYEWYRMYRIEEIMSKKEKIIATIFTLTMLLLIASAIYTLEKNKPEGHVFRYEKWVFQIFGK